MDRPDAVDRVREARRRISKAHDHDSGKLLAYYEEAMQERYRDRLVRTPEHTDDRGQQAVAAGRTSHRGGPSRRP